MDFTRPAGTWLTVGELRHALADLDERTPIKLVVNDTQVGVAEVVTSRFLVELLAGAVALRDGVGDLLAEFVEGTISARDAKVKARLILAAAGIEVSK